MDGSKIDGDLFCTLSVTEYNPPAKSRGLVHTFTNLYVKNFPSTTFEDADLIVSHFLLILCSNCLRSTGKSPQQ